MVSEIGIIMNLFATKLWATKNAVPLRDFWVHSFKSITLGHDTNEIGKENCLDNSSRFGRCKENSLDTGPPLTGHGTPCWRLRGLAAGFVVLAAFWRVRASPWY
jgi:hypothetical protein